MKERDELLDKYSARVFKNRKEHIRQLEFGPEGDTLTANTRAIPGSMTARGCCYAGCKGVVVGPMKDVAVITHGPIGCAFYSWGTRRNKAKADAECDDMNFVPYSLCTDMRPTDIVFGGEKKLEKAIDEVMDIFHPKCIMICSTCPIGLIGDDVQAVARRTEAKYNIKAIREEMEHYKSKLTGKTAGIFVGGSRSHHYQTLLRDLGMETIMAGYEFAHRDDYEGRDVLPSIKADADTKNIEEITVEPDPEKFRRKYTDEEIARLKEDGVELDTYDGMIPEMKKGYMVVDDYNFHEVDRLGKIMKPDIIFSGIKDKYSTQKDGIGSRQLHSYDYSGPYSGFRGAVIFARDVAMSIYTPTWGLIKAPWKNAPLLTGTIACRTATARRAAAPTTAPF